MVRMDLKKIMIHVYNLMQNYLRLILVKSFQLDDSAVTNICFKKLENELILSKKEREHEEKSPAFHV